MTVTGLLKELGYTTVNDAFYRMAKVWDSWYKGKVKKFHTYTVRNGQTSTRCKRYSLGMAKQVCEDWAGLLLNEKVKITLGGEREQAFVDEILKANNFTVKGNEMQERKFALGTVAYVARVVGMEATENGVVDGSAKGIEIDYVTVDHIFPLAWRNGDITECAFSGVATVEGEQYLYLHIHKLDEAGNYEIHNGLYRYDAAASDASAKENLLGQVRGFENIPHTVRTKSPQRTFVIDRPNLANNVDDTVPLGISVYANAIDVLQGTDIAYDSYVNEFVLGKKRIMVKPTAARYENGSPVFDSDDVTFYVLPEDLDDGSVIHEIDMKLRTAEHSTGIQDNLNLLSRKCGLGDNYYKFDSGALKTATEVVSENSILFRSIKKQEVVLESVITELCRIILRLGNTAMGQTLDEDVEIQIDFDDSIIEDKTAERNNDRQDMAAGILNDWEYRAKWYGEDEATAKASLPGAEDLTTEPEEEIE